MDDSNKELIEQIDNSVRQHFANAEEAPEESEVRELYESLFNAFSSLPMYPNAQKLDVKSVIDELVKKYCEELAITKRFGFAYKDEDIKPWLGEVESDVDWFYWNRYKMYLLRTKKWSHAAVRSVDKDTHAILDLLANPQLESGFERRGLVVASVQSGKTANYIGLICRAADVGYKIIIVMAGVHNVLRNQTQARLEDGFTGFNIVDQQRMEPVGVGLGNASRRPIACTSREADFNKRRASALRGIQTAHTNEPWLFVIKKNSNSLKQVYEWLQDNANPNDQLLLIDDEADNASINGKYKREKREDEPTRINGQIRNILNHFTRYCYVGYTATPFANILIDPNVELDGYGSDLFPKSFIYTLEESSDYFGASKVFADYDGPNPKYLRFIDDIEFVLPPKHKSDFEVAYLPESLKEAVRTFVVATTIRALRGDKDSHSTMMVNVSPYKYPQKTVAWRIADYIRELNDAVKAYGFLPPEVALSSSDDMKMLKATWWSEYRKAGDFGWDQIQHSLYDTTRTIHVVSINTDSNDRLDYEHQTEHVVAVGGYRLSRGLTLEGLVVSYYSRNARAYDALMQMARWFGYRPGYEDLCRVWMSEKSAGWYKFVADSTDDLFDELRDMRQIRSTPRDYGLKIRQCPDSLTVTARNKMGTGQRVKAPTDLNNGFVETVAFDRRPEVQKANQKAAEQLLSSLVPYRDAESEEKEGLLFKGVPHGLIEGFLRAYANDDAHSPKSQYGPVRDYIADRLQDGELEEWDVLVAQGDRKSDAADMVTLPVVGEIARERRYPGLSTDAETLVVGEKHRLASRGIDQAGLTKSQINAARAAFKKDHPEKEKGNCSDRYYRRQRQKPLLVIHPVSMRYNEEAIKRKIEENKPIKLANGFDTPAHHENALGWSISLPHTDKQTILVDYIFNEVALKSISLEYDEGDSDDDYEDE
ncbi:MAG: Z1 domain-containing protein [Olegusella sp.]|nr:Z1 domain-containing protein [Olegusella sp.]